MKACTLILATLLLAGEAHGADKVRIGVSNYNLSNLSVGVAHTRGFFKEEGLDAEIIRMNPNVATMALITGDVDYTTLIGSIIGAAIKGAKLKMVACSQDRTPLAIVVKPEIRSVKDLKGKMIGIGSYGATPDLLVRMVVKHHGLDPEADIKATALGTDGARLAALKEGVVDAIIVAPPIDYEAKKLGFNVLVRTGELFQFPYNGLGTNVKKLAERPDQVKRSIRALIKANNYIRKNKEGTVAVLIQWAKTRPELAVASYDSSWEFFSPDANIPEDGVRIVVDNYRKSLGITRQIPLTEVMDTSALREAQKELGFRK